MFFFVNVDQGCENVQLIAFVGAEFRINESLYAAKGSLLVSLSPVRANTPSNDLRVESVVLSVGTDELDVDDL